MLGSVFQLHQQVIRRVDPLICYVGHQAAPLRLPVHCDRSQTPGL